MPDRYWVGGTASWDGTAGTKWSATSGGPGGASVPTTADDVFFNASSGTGTVTIATGNTGARSINCTGFAGTITGSGAGSAITVAGSVTLSAAMTYTHTGTMTFTGTGTLTTAGKAFSAVTVDGSGITLTLGDALNTSSRNLTVNQGTFNTANFTVSVGSLESQSGLTRSITLGSSTVTVVGIAIALTSSTNLTFNAGTSQINLSFTGVSIVTEGVTFHNVSFTASGTGTRAVFGVNTFNNLTFTASATGLSTLELGDNQTVNGTFTCAGSSSFARGFVRSSTPGSTRTVTAAAISANDCDFRDITLAGAAAGASPTRAGDCGGNSGITFPAAKTVFRVGGSTTWAGSSSWALTSGGAGSNNNFPLAQDTAVINNSATASSISLDTYNIGTLDASTRTNAITLGNASTAFRYGSYVLGSGVTVTGTSPQTFFGRGTMTFTSAGKTVTFPITVNAPGGTFQLGDAFNSSNSVIVVTGTFNANNYNLTCGTFASSGAVSRTITMGSGLWTLSSTGTVWNTATTTNLTFNRNTANILLSNTTTTARTFAGGSLSFNRLTIGGATGTSVLTLSGASSFTELASTKTVAHTVRLSSDLGTIDTWSITGTSGNEVYVDSSVAGTRRTFSLTNITSGINFLVVQDIGVNQTNRFYVGASSTNDGNNLNVIFTAAPTGGVVVPVTGVSATGQVGEIIFPNVDVPVTGVFSTGQVGAVTTEASATADVTGVEAVGQVGTADAVVGVVADLTGVQATGQVGDVVVPNVDVEVTGVTATGQVGELVFPDVEVRLTGVSSTGQVGTVTADASVTADVTGVSSTGQVGQVDVDASATTGATGVEAVGQVGSVTVTATADVPVEGLSSTGEVGTVTVSGEALVQATGVSSTGQVGTAGALPSVEAAVTGLSATGVAGSVMLTGDSNLSLVGLSGTAQVGDVVAFTSVVADATGVGATGQVGAATAVADALVPAEGVSATGACGSVVVTGTANLALDGVSAIGSVGVAQAIPSIEVPVTGVAATAAVGSVAVTGSAIVILLGISATGRVGQVNVWGNIVPDPGSTWTEIDPSDTTLWTEVSPSPGTTWNPVAA